jgi:hypothetical protein
MLNTTDVTGIVVPGLVEPEGLRVWTRARPVPGSGPQLTALGPGGFDALLGHAGDLGLKQSFRLGAPHLAQVLDLVADGRLRAQVAARFPLWQTGRASSSGSPLESTLDASTASTRHPVR